MNNPDTNTFALQPDEIGKALTGKEVPLTSKEYLQRAAGEATGINVDKLVEQLNAHAEGFDEATISAMVDAATMINQDMKNAAATPGAAEMMDKAQKTEIYLSMIRGMRKKLDALKNDPNEKVHPMSEQYQSSVKTLNQLMAAASRDTGLSIGALDLRSKQDSVQPRTQKRENQQ